MKRTDDISKKIGLLVFFWVIYMVLNHFLILGICQLLQKDNLMVIMEKFVGTQKIFAVLVFIIGLPIVLISHKKAKKFLVIGLFSVVLLPYIFIGQRTEITTDSIIKYGFIGLKKQTINYEEIVSVAITGAEITGRSSNSYEVEYSIITKADANIKLVLTSSYFPKYYTTPSNFELFNKLLENSANVVNKADFNRLKE